MCTYYWFVCNEHGSFHGLRVLPCVARRREGDVPSSSIEWKAMHRLCQKEGCLGLVMDPRFQREKRCPVPDDEMPHSHHPFRRGAGPPRMDVRNESVD